MRGTILPPDYEPARDDGRYVVRRFGSSVTHVVEAAPELVVARSWLGSPYWSFDGSLAARCRAVLRGDHRGLAIMRPDSRKVSCRACRRADEESV